MCDNVNRFPDKLFPKLGKRDLICAYYQNDNYFMMVIYLQIYIIFII